MSINQSEVQKYWEIFAVLANGGDHLDGSQAASVLKNSGLNDVQLEKVWDLADIDNDGRLDFEEFCVAMKLIYNVLGGEAADIPNRLPDYLVPESKSHLVAATQALSKTAPKIETPVEEDDTPGLRDGFDWYMSPADKGKYEAIYSANVDRHGQVTFAALDDLYSSLDVPDTDIRFAWNLVNPNADLTVGKDQALAFLHMLNQRNEGYRIPRSVPASLRASFEKNQINYSVSSVKLGSGGERAPLGGSTSKKNAFAEGYLDRLGLGGRTGGYKTSGTDFTASKEQDWEEVRLKRQLAELESKIKDAESAASKRAARGADGSRNSKAALVRRELEQMLDYKRRELRDLEEGKGSAQGGASLASARDDLELMKQQVEALESHLAQRNDVLEDLRRQIDDEKARR
ncbi:endocytosis defective- protein [Orbilia blumenaviensis]|uniref:Endocytosis protein 3 n=1 Tax=Orbilia blumenaviensis TaxID=1796055 RepID=A0AAV9UQ02_9PEZI